MLHQLREKHAENIFQIRINIRPTFVYNFVDIYHSHMYNSNLELWAKFLNAEEREEFNMIAEKDPYIKSAYDQLQIISQDKEKRMEYEAREKAIRDHNQFLLEAEQRGMEEGMKKGMEKGMEEGRKLEAIAIARNMKKENFPDAMIVRSTGLSASEVANL